MGEVEINGRVIDLSLALPLRLRDWKALESQGVRPEDLASGKFSAISEVIYHILHKADESVTREQVDDLALEGPVITTVLGAIATAGQRSVADRPS